MNEVNKHIHETTTSETRRTTTVMEEEEEDNEDEQTFTMMDMSSNGIKDGVEKKKKMMNKKENREKEGQTEKKKEEENREKEEGQTKKKKEEENRKKEENQTEKNKKTKKSDINNHQQSTCRQVIAGGVFGCVEFVLGSARLDTALAITYCTVMVLPRTEVWNIVAAAPDLAPDVQHLLANQLDKETPDEAETKGAFDGVKLKTQNNFLKKFRLRNKKKEEMIDGEYEALQMTEKGNTKVGGILFSAISSQTLVNDEKEKVEKI